MHTSEAVFSAFDSLVSPNSDLLLSVLDLGINFTTAAIGESSSYDMLPDIIFQKMQLLLRYYVTKFERKGKLTVASPKGCQRLVLRITRIWCITGACKEDMGIKGPIML